MCFVLPVIYKSLTFSCAGICTSACFVGKRPTSTDWTTCFSITTTSKVKLRVYHEEITFQQLVATMVAFFRRTAAKRSKPQEERQEEQEETESSHQRVAVCTGLSQHVWRIPQGWKRSHYCLWIGSFTRWFGCRCWSVCSSTEKSVFLRRSSIAKRLVIITASLRLVCSSHRHPSITHSSKRWPICPTTVSSPRLLISSTVRVIASSKRESCSRMSYKLKKLVAPLH